MPRTKTPKAAPSKSLELTRSICKESFYDFVLECWGAIPGVTPFINNWHIKVLCEELQDLAEDVFAGRRKKHNVVFNLPFGTSKSSIISILFPAWCWTRKPDMRFLCGTHTDSLALNLAYKHKGVVESEKYQRLFPYVSIKPDRSAKGDFENTAGGERVSCTVGGKTPMGRHAHIVLVDDALDPEGARSEAELATAAHFMNVVIPGRVVDKEVSPTVLVMQRLHPRDPSHVMLENARNPDAIPVRHICLPGELAPDAAAVSPPELEANYVDGLLDVNRLSRRVLASFRAQMRFGYSGQVLQKPKSKEGGMFEERWFQKVVRAAPYDSKRVMYVDRAGTEGAGCFTAMVLMAKDKEGLLYVEHVQRGQWEPKKRNDMIVLTAERHRARFGPKHTPTIVIEAERGSTGLESYQKIASRLLSLGFRVREDMPSGSKDVRAEPWSDELASGLVHLVNDADPITNRPCSWDINAFIDEHVAFQPMPGKRVGGIVDQVDASSGARNWLMGRRKVGPMHSIALGGHKKGVCRVVVCTRDALADLVIENSVFLIEFVDPSPAGEGVVCSDESLESIPGSGVRVEGAVVGGFVTVEITTSPPPDEPVVVGEGVVPYVAAELRPPVSNVNGGEGSAQPPPPSLGGLTKLYGRHEVRCLDLAPSELGADWDRPVDGYSKLPSDLVFTREEGRKLWAFLTRKRGTPPPDVYLFVDDGDRRALSAAMALCDVLVLKRDEVLVNLSETETKYGGKEPPNAHVHAMVKSSRALVLS